MAGGRNKNFGSANTVELLDTSSPYEDWTIGNRLFSNSSDNGS